MNERDVDPLPADERALIEAVRQATGMDFHNYAPASIGRSLQRVLRLEGLHSIGQLHELISRDSSALERLSAALTIPVTTMFREPAAFAALREHIAPYLGTYPSLRCWIAGCASGEEAYSLAIVLHEEGLLHKTQIYATDVNTAVLRSARTGLLNADALEEHARNYALTGGRKSFAEYYVPETNGLHLHSFLMEHITFARHDLVADSSFNEFHLILCRNVLIYFGRELQHRVLELLDDSLTMFGYLLLGRCESLAIAPVASGYRTLTPHPQIYRKSPN